MEIGMVGLGKMGLNLVTNLFRNNVNVVAFDISPALVKEAESAGASGVASLEELVAKLPSPRIVWIMVPAGNPTKAVVNELTNLLEKGDIIIDGGNSFYEDSIQHYNKVLKKGIHFFDSGSSGGQEGARNGGNFMIGGNAEIFPIIEPIFKAIAQPNGYLYTGETGSGHYLKMVHNGIEYGMMGAIAEGFELLERSPYNYNGENVADLWAHGSVIRGWLMELMRDAFTKDPKLEQISGVMYSSGEGRWTVEEALKREVPLPVITASLMMRYRSLEEDTFTGKVVAALRQEFGGHAVKSKA
ncbi:decarboxylating 6-phosphogluconate dehydrogenase [Lachnospiraceae bacterium ZAX-1]